MPIKNIGAFTIEVDDEGFMTDHTKWNRDIAAAIAAEEGIAQLTDRHMAVIDFMRKEFIEKGTGPSIRRLTKESGVETKELYALFPGGPAKQSAKIAGIKKPAGCI